MKITTHPPQVTPATASGSQGPRTDGHYVYGSHCIPHIIAVFKNEDADSNAIRYSSWLAITVEWSQRLVTEVLQWLPGQGFQSLPVCLLFLRLPS